MRPDEYPAMPPPQWSTNSWVYLAGKGIDRWVEVRGLVPAARGQWGLFCARDGDRWSVRVDPSEDLPTSLHRPD